MVENNEFGDLLTSQNNQGAQIISLKDVNLASKQYIQAQISSVSKYGQLSIDFTDSMYYLQSDLYFRILNSTEGVLDISLELYNSELSEARIENWKIVDYSQSSLSIELEFNDPRFVSTFEVIPPSHRVGFGHCPSSVRRRPVLHQL